jgi:hypothetical protein
MALVRSIVFSVVASFLATVAARRLLSVSEPLADGKRQQQGPQTIVIVMPVFVGNSNNRIGWVKEDHHHHHPRFKRPGS